ncbi:MAG: DUF488 domain-containing protein [Gammaproteobacteria bacterium]|nr:DUF488 domain-containing protein [Gammaproteobacteria bacterium]
MTNNELQKYLFLYTQYNKDNPCYEFVPYKFGCYSFQSISDKFKLISLGYLKDTQGWMLSDSKKNHLSNLVNGEAKELKFFYEKYSPFKGRKLIQYIYRKYPYYAINSEIAEDILEPEEYANIKLLKEPRQGKLFTTIGYEGITIENYLNKLIKNDVRVLIDVRKNPISRKFGFSKTKLSNFCNNVGIGYEHIPKLGIISEKRTALNTSKDYENLFLNYKTVLSKEKESVTQLYNLYLKSDRIAITCFEKDHAMCHRTKIAEAVSGMAHDKLDIIHL